MRPERTERKAPTGTITGPCLDTTWQTPPELVAPVRHYFGGRIPFDAATSADNPCKARRFVTKAENGLSMKWPKRVWVNPPYGRALRLWMPKIREAAELGSEIVALVPCSRWEQFYWQYSLVKANLVCFIRRRVQFIRPSSGERVSGNPYANMYLAWNGDPKRFRDCFRHLGPVFSLRCLAQPEPEELPK